MNRSKKWFSGGSLFIVGGFFLLFSLLPRMTAAGLQNTSRADPLLGDPPAAPGGGELQVEADVEALSAAGCTKANCLFMPMVFNPYTDMLDQATAIRLYQTLYLPGNNIASGWNGDVGSCQAGTTSAAFKEAVLKRINFFRLAAGVPALSAINATYTVKAEEAALMMSKAGALSHAPDTSWPCYTANGKEAAGNSNLYLGRSGPDAISGYVRDPGSNNIAAGHRRWILYPQTQQMGTGDIPSSSGYSQANALWVFDSHMWEARPTTRSAFVAWPPNGYIPYQVVYARWSFAYPKANFSNANVSLTKNGSPVSVTRYATTDGYGENTLVWIISSMGDGDTWPKPTKIDTYVVTITGVVINGQSKNFSYPVMIFDPGL
jgi:uncharacterized protein YkwD